MPTPLRSSFRAPPAAPGGIPLGPDSASGTGSGINDHTILIRPTLTGDENGDGVVDDYDLLLFNGFNCYNNGATTLGWQAGDFNGDNAVNDNDLLIFNAANNYLVDAAAPAVTAQAFSATVGVPANQALATFSAVPYGSMPGDFAASINWGDGSPAGVGLIAGPLNGPFTVTAPHTYATAGAKTMTVTVTYTPAGTGTAAAANATASVAAPAAVVPPATRVRAVADSTTTATVNWLAPAPSASGVADYLVEMTTDGTNFTPVGTVAGSGTGGQALNLDVAGLLPSTHYDFRVIARNPAGVNAIPTYSAPIRTADPDGAAGNNGDAPGPTPAPGVQPNINDPSAYPSGPNTSGAGDDNTPGWYRVTLVSANLSKGDSGDTSNGSASIVMGPYYDPTNPLTSLWVQAQSWKDAVKKVVHGSVTNSNTGKTYTFAPGNWSGALELQDNPTIPAHGGSPALTPGKSIVMEDLYDQPNDDLDFNDNFFQVDVDKLSLNSVTAADSTDASNSVTTTGGPAEDDLYVVEKGNADGSYTAPTVDLSATLLPAGPGDDGDSHILYTLKRGQTVVGTGVFNANGVVLPTTETQGDFEFDAGVDSNGNGILDGAESAGGSTSSTSGEVTHSIAIHAVKIEVRVNGTDATNDDMVRKGYEGFGPDVPASYPTVQGEVRLARSLPQDISVELKNPDGRLVFGNTVVGGIEADTDPTTVLQGAPLTETLPKAGDWVSFKIGGISVSETVNDAVVAVNATIPGTGVGLSVSNATDKAMTVFWFSNPKTVVASGADYADYVSVINGQAMRQLNTANGQPAALITGSANIAPFGLDVSAVPISQLRLGIVQNVDTQAVSANYESYVNWDSGLDEAETEVYDKMTQSGSTGRALDMIANNQFTPLYDMGEQFDASGHASYSTNDTPQIAQVALPVHDATWVATAINDPATVYGTYDMRLQSLTLDDAFHDWTVVVRKVGGVIKVIAVLSETGWSIDASSDTVPVGIHPDLDASTGGHQPGLGPILSGMTAKQQIQAAMLPPTGISPGDPMRIVSNPNSR